jgi:hypothetical protein
MDETVDVAAYDEEAEQIKAALVRLGLIEVRQPQNEFFTTARGELLIDIMLKNAYMRDLYTRCMASGHEAAVARIALMVDGVRNAIQAGRLHELEAIALA